MVGPEQKTAEDTAAYHPAELEDRADKQRRGKADADDPRQLIGEPASRQRKRVQHELEPDGDDRQGRRHRERLDRKFGAQRQPPQHAAKPRSRDCRERQMHGPAGESQAHRMDAAADVKRHRPLFERVEQVAVGDADRDRRNQQPRQEAEMPAGVSDDAGSDTRRGATPLRLARTSSRHRHAQRSRPNAWREPGFALRERSLSRRCHRDLVEAHRVFEDQLVERRFPECRFSRSMSHRLGVRPRAVETREVAGPQKVA